jgi:hypothetical protein
MYPICTQGRDWVRVMGQIRNVNIAVYSLICGICGCLANLLSVINAASDSGSITLAWALLITSISLGVVAIILGVLSLRKSKDIKRVSALIILGMVGMVCGVISLAFSILQSIIWLVTSL